jgi:hypothetical protein
MTTGTDVSARSGREVNPRLGELTGVLLETLDQRGAEVAEQVRERIASYGDNGVVPPEDLAASCVENLRFVIEGLGSGETGDPAPAAATGVRRAQAGVPLPAVLAAYRVGFRVIWEHVTREARLRGIPADVVVDATADAVVAHDVFTEAMTAAYNATLTRQLMSQEAERAALVEALLSGAVIDRRTLWEVADLLGLTVSSDFVVVAATLSAPGRAVLPGIEMALGRLGCPPRGGCCRTSRSGWSTSAKVPRRAGRRGAGVGGLRRAIGISPVFHELTGRSTVPRPGAPRGLGSRRQPGESCRFEENPVGIAAAAAGGVLEQVADGCARPARRVGGGRALHVLLETLRVWIEVGGSANKTASRLLVPRQHRSVAGYAASRRRRAAGWTTLERRRRALPRAPGAPRLRLRSREPAQP